MASPAEELLSIPAAAARLGLEERELRRLLVFLPPGLGARVGTFEVRQRPSAEQGPCVVGPTTVDGPQSLAHSRASGCVRSAAPRGGPSPRRTTAALTEQGTEAAAGWWPLADELVGRAVPRTPCSISNLPSTSGVRSPFTCHPMSRDMAFGPCCPSRGWTINLRAGTAKAAADTLGSLCGSPSSTGQLAAATRTSGRRDWIYPVPTGIRTLNQRLPLARLFRLRP